MTLKDDNEYKGCSTEGCHYAGPYPLREIKIIHIIGIFCNHCRIELEVIGARYSSSDLTWRLITSLNFDYIAIPKLGNLAGFTIYGTKGGSKIETR